jgi:hypothetical protein
LSTRKAETNSSTLRWLAVLTLIGELAEFERLAHEGHDVTAIRIKVRASEAGLVLGRGAA